MHNKKSHLVAVILIKVGFEIYYVDLILAVQPIKHRHYFPDMSF